MADPLQHGLVTTCRPDGSLLAETTYEHGTPHGPYRDYWSNGLLSCEGQYVNGRQEGEWRFYNRDGTLREVIRFEEGREVVDWDRFFGRTNRDNAPDDSRPADR
jgi:antitoxin component YwqK of YwqJK toxin-antitoxin module